MNNLFDKLGRVGAILCLLPTFYYSIQFFLHLNQSALALEMAVWLFFWIGFAGAFWGLSENHDKPNRFIGWLFLVVGFACFIGALLYAFLLISQHSLKDFPIVKEFIVSCIAMALGAFSVAKSNLMDNTTFKTEV